MCFAEDGVQFQKGGLDNATVIFRGRVRLLCSAVLSRVTVMVSVSELRLGVVAFPLGGLTVPVTSLKVKVP